MSTQGIRIKAGYYRGLSHSPLGTFGAEVIYPLKEMDGQLLH